MEAQEKTEQMTLPVENGYSLFQGVGPHNTVLCCSVYSGIAVGVIFHKYSELDKDLLRSSPAQFPMI